LFNTMRRLQTASQQQQSAADSGRMWVSSLIIRSSSSSSSSFGTTTICGFSLSQPSLQVLLSSAASFQFFTFRLFRSSITLSFHHCLVLHTGLVPMGPQSNNFVVRLAWSIRWIWPSHLILCTLMNLTISAASINLSISKLFRILHVLSILTGPNIFLCICLSKESCHSLIKSLWPSSPRRQFIDNELKEYQNMIYIKLQSVHLPATVTNKRNHVAKGVVDGLIKKIWKGRHF
jgi:hypothetical protein